MKTHTQILSVMAALCLSSLLPASAQSYNDSSGAPIFAIPNFVGDARYDDLYVYMHEMQHDQWDVYRRRLEAAAGRIVRQQPLQYSPTPEDPGAGSPYYHGVPVVGGIGGYGSTAGTTAAATTETAAMSQPVVTTNVSGAVLGANQAGPVPGLVEP